ncbi:MAG: twin-arginine translocation signal domain-containing protein, partial [Coriobacteriia bacterium]|nr:twin-arginine translocation signal domain-containing protein [Coriobacteriia bacterium]
MVQANPDEPVKLVTSVGISRRDFVGGALAAGLGLAITELAGCAPEDDEGDVSGGDSNPGPTPDNSPTPESPDDITTDGTNDQGLSTSENATSAVFVVNHTDGTDDGVSRLIELMGSNKLDFYRTAATPRGLIAAADVVIIKVNCQWAERGGTNSDLLERLVEAIAAHPDGFSGEVVVADNGQGQYGTNGRGGSLSWGAA